MRNRSAGLTSGFGFSLLCVLFLSFPPLLFSQFEESDGTSPLWLTVTKDVGYFPIADALNLTAHEGGHYLLSRVFDENASFQLRIGKILLPEGLVSYSDEKVPTWYRPFIAIAGTTFNRGLAELSNLSLQSNLIPYHLQPVLSEVYLGGYIDFPSNVTFAFIGDLIGGFSQTETSNDFHNFVLNLSWDKGVVSRLVIYGGLLTLAGVDMYYSRDKIRKNWSVLQGQKFE